MPRASINLGEPEGLAAVGGTWKFAQGYIPGAPNDGLVAEGEGQSGAPARLRRLQLGGLPGPDGAPVPRLYLYLVPD